MARSTWICGVAIAAFASSLVCDASDWSRFRGPNGSGVSRDTAKTPVTWSDSKNLKWKTALPGPGSSCPIVVGDRVFVTSWSGYGMSREDAGDQENLRLHLSCIDRATGDVAWTKTIEPFLPDEDKYGGMFAEHGYASHTPVSDGENVYVYLGKTGAIAFNLDGDELWRKQIGTESGARGWGSASSPILFEDLMIVAATAESEALVALDKATGDEVWRQEASGFNSVWGTPALAKVDDERTDLVIAVPGEVWGLNPRTGKLRWYCDAVGANSFCASAVVNDGVVYAVESGPGGGGGVAVRAGGKGNVTQSHVLWAGQQAGRIGSPLVHDGRMYTFARGVANCFDARTGDEIFQGRLKKSPAKATDDADAGGERGGRPSRRMGGQDYASPVLADGKIYFTSRGGDIQVLDAGDTFRQLAVNRVTKDREDFSATPAVSDGEIYLRSNKHLYCVARLSEEADVPVPVASADVEQEADDADENPRRPGGPRGAGRGGGRRGGPGGGGGGEFDPVAMFKQSDADGDGKLSGDEITGPVKDNLDALDGDKDGAITLDEFQTGLRELMRSGGRGDPRSGRPERPKRPELEDETV